MIYFQSILTLYESTTEEKQKIVVNQLVTFADTNKQHESFFLFLCEKMENPSSLPPSTLKSILNISIDFLNSQNPQFTISNIKQYVQFLIRLFSLKTQPRSYEKYIEFLKTSFRLVNQYNQESLFSTFARIPYEQSIIPLSVLSIQNGHFFNRILEIIDNSFNTFKKNQQLSIWTIAMSNLLKYTDNNHKSDEKNAVDKSIALLLNKVFVNKFISLDRKFNLIDASLNYMPQKIGDDLLSSHCLNLLSSVSISSSIDEIVEAANFAITVLIRLQKSEIKNLTINQLVDSVITYVLPGYRSGQAINASLTSFFNKVDQDYLQSKINEQIQSENVSLSTLFLISRFPNQKTIPHLLTRARVDQKSQYILIFYFLSHNLVPFRYLPRLFSILEPEDLHFLNEIFEQKPVLYCTAAIKFLSQCKRVEKIEFISSLFSAAKSIPIINSPYAKSAFITVACLRSLSKQPRCPIRLLLDYLYSCINSTKAISDETKQEKEQENQSNNDHIEQSGEIADDNDNENNEDNNNKENAASKNKDNDDMETAQVRTSEISSSASQNIQGMNSISTNDQLDLTNEDITMITNVSKESESKNVPFYNIKKASEKLNRPTFCQSQAIHSIATSNPQLKESMINEALEKIKEGDLIYTVIIGSLSDDRILIHNCAQTLALSDLFLLTFFFTTAGSCSPDLILKEMQEYIAKDPESVPQSFVARLFSSRSSTTSRRQRIVRRCIIGMSPFVSFSPSLYETLLASFPTEPLPIQTGIMQSNTYTASSPLVCESIISVCNRLTNKEDLHLILQKLISITDSLEPNLLIQALISILNANKELSNKDALLVTKLWINFLISNKIDLNSQKSKQNSQIFESVLLLNNNARNIYIKEIEEAIRVHGDNPYLFSSLQLSLPFIKEFNLTKQPSILTLIIANTLSQNETVLQFCVNLLRETYQMNNILSPLKTVVFSNEYVESVRYFFSELSTKFQSKQLIQLVEALLTYYKDKQPRHQEAVFLFTVFAVLKQPLIFIQNKFISKIASSCEKMTRKNDYAIMFYLCRAFDTMNSADRNVFFNEFIASPENEFVSTYLEKYSSYYEALEPLLIPKIIQLKNINKKWREFIEFERLLKLFNGYVRLSFRNATSSEKLSRIIFALLLSISTINFIRNRGFSIDSYLTIIDQLFSEFKNSTGLCLVDNAAGMNQSKISLTSDNDYYEFVSFFASSFQYLQNDVVLILLSLIEQLISTIHIDCALLCLSSYLVSTSNSSSEETKRLKNKTVDLFTSFVKNCKFDSVLISFVISRVPSAFSTASLKQMSSSYLTIFLKLSTDAAIKAADPSPPLELVLNIVRSSTPSFISQFIPQIMDALRSIVSSGRIKISSILVLNIIGELGRRKQDPTCLLKDGPISFRSIIPYLVSNDNEIQTRVKAIFSLMIFGKAQQEPDFELIFTSLMSIFVGYENDTSSFVAVALDLLRTIEKSYKVDVDMLKLLRCAFQPVLSVGDANCNEAINELLKYLKKLTLSIEDTDLFSYVLEMMTLFAKPKRNFSLSPK